MRKEDLLVWVIKLITPKADAVVKHIVPIITSKSTLTCTNCGKTGHSMETSHNMKREALVVPIVIIKFTEHVTRTKTQPIKLGKIHVRYPYIIYSNI